MGTTPDADGEQVQLEGRLHQEGWADHVTVDRLLDDWERVANDVDDYALEIDDYINDLTGRDALELLIGWASPDLGLDLLARVEPADERFRSVTTEDGGDAVGRGFPVDDQDGWWWRRRPTTGPLADRLDERP
jgi:hypothetical protein